MNFISGVYETRLITLPAGSFVAAPSHPTMLGDVWVGFTRTSPRTSSPLEQTRNRQNL